MAYGEALGYNFRIGRDQIPQPSQMAEQSITTDPEVGQYDKNDLLANRGKMTQDVYENMSILRNYAQELAKKGIDVTKPDFTQEGGGPEHLAFLKLDAAVKHAANALKNEYTAEQQLRPLQAEGKIRYNQDADFSRLYAQNPDNYYSTAPLENVREANIRGRQNTYTPQDQARINSEIAREASQIDQQVAQGVLSQQEGELQKSYLVNNAYGTPASAFSDGGGAGRQAKSMIPLFERVTNQTRGAFEPTDAKPIIIRGKNFTASNSLSGDNFGEQQIEKEDKLGNRTLVTVPKKIKRTLKDKQGNVFLQYEDPDLDIEQVNNIAPDEVFRRLVESNSGKYGGTAALPMFYEELRKKGLLGDNRTVGSNTVFGETTPEIARQTIPDNPATERKLALVKSDFEKLADPNSNFGQQKVNTRKGTMVFKYDEDEGVYLDNFDDFGLAKKPTHIVYNDFLTYLQDAGFFDAVNSNFNKSEPKISVVDFDSKWKSLKSGESLTGPDGKKYIKK